MTLEEGGGVTTMTIRVEISIMAMAVMVGVVMATTTTTTMTTRKIIHLHQKVIHHQPTIVQNEYNLPTIVHSLNI